MTLRTRASDAGVNPLPRLIVRYIALVVSITAILTAGSAYVDSQEAKESEAELRSSLEQSCRDTRGPLVHYFLGQIESVTATDPKLFPDIPRKTFERLLKERVHELRGLVKTFEVADCDDLYG